MKPQKQFYESYAREQLIEALLSLMQRYDFHEITVLMITQEAGVARRTFYLYYKTKVDILTDYYNVLTKEYDAGLEDSRRSADEHSGAVEHTGHPTQGLKNQAVYFFSFWLRYREYLQLLHRQGLFQLLMSSFNDYLVRTLGTFATDHVIALHAAFYSGGLWALLFTWTEDGFKETPEELAEVAGNFTGAVMI